MKKIISIILVTIMLFSIVGCKSKEDIVSNNSSSPYVSDIITSNTTNINSSEDNSQDDSSSNVVTNNDSDTKPTDSSIKTQNPVKKPNSPSNKTSSVDSANKGTQSNNKVTESTTQNNNSSNPTGSSSDNSQDSDEGFEYYSYDSLLSYREVVDYVTVNDIIYLLLKYPNRLLVIDAENGEILRDDTLKGQPGEINIINNDFWISFPALKQIRTYDINSLVEKDRYYFEHEVCSFDVCDDYIVYAEGESWTYIYRYKISTKECIKIANNDNRKFARPNTIINKELNLIYVGESGNTGCVIWCYNLETLELISFYKKDNYGYCNAKRQMYFLNGKVYWTAFRFDQANISNFEHQYDDGTGMLYVDEDYVITTKGVYLQEDGTKILNFTSNDIWTFALITESDHLLFIEHENVYIFPNAPDE